MTLDESADDLFNQIIEKALIDDGVAFRLAVQLGLIIDNNSWMRGFITVSWPSGDDLDEITSVNQPEEGLTKLEATRRAIVDAAKLAQG
jgi:hypothetical protein